MGLDIIAYSHLEAVGLHTEEFCHQEDEGGDLAHISAFVITPNFLSSMDGLPVLADIIVDYRGASIPYPNGGCYRRTEKTKAYGFHAGSYGGYNRWREDLGKQFNSYPLVKEEFRIGKPDPDKPFYELLWFADNEGTIGPVAATRLLADFREHETEYVQEREDHGSRSSWGVYDIERYRDWMTACELASQNGLIEFR